MNESFTPPGVTGHVIDLDSVATGKLSLQEL